MDNKSPSKSQLQHLGASRMPKTYGILNIQNVAPLFTCILCNNILKEATTINRCNHTFCKECIYQKLQGEGIKCCPTCNEDLSSLCADEYLRSDELICSMVKTIFKNSIPYYADDEQIETQQVMPPQIVLDATSDSTTQEGFSETAARQLKEQYQKQTSRKRRHHKFSSCQTEKDKEMDEIEKVEKETLESKLASLGDDSVTSKEKDIEEFSSESELFGKIEKTSQSVWFSLVPQENETGYPRLANSYIHIKNGDMLASTLNKYLMTKLNLESENEVEVCCYGVPLVKSLTIHTTLEICIDCVNHAPPNHSKSRKLNEKKAMMKLTYRRANNNLEHPNEDIMSEQSSC